MKTIKNTEVKIKLDETSGLLTRAGILKLVVSAPSEKGISVADMRNRIKLLETLEKAGAEDIQLEDADFTILRNLYNSFPWAFTHKDIVELADHLDELEKNK